jgi:hypothetical protein
LSSSSSSTPNAATSSSSSTSAAHESVSVLPTKKTTSATSRLKRAAPAASTSAVGSTPSSSALAVASSSLPLSSSVSKSASSSAATPAIFRSFCYLIVPPATSSSTPFAASPSLSSSTPFTSSITSTPSASFLAAAMAQQQPPPPSPASIARTLMDHGASIVYTSVEDCANDVRFAATSAIANMNGNIDGSDGNPHRPRRRVRGDLSTPFDGHDAHTTTEEDASMASDRLNQSSLSDGQSPHSQRSSAAAAGKPSLPAIHMVIAHTVAEAEAACAALARLGIESERCNFASDSVSKSGGRQQSARRGNSARRQHQPHDSSAGMEKRSSGTGDRRTKHAGFASYAWVAACVAAQQCVHPSESCMFVPTPPSMTVPIVPSAPASTNQSSFSSSANGTTVSASKNRPSSKAKQVARETQDDALSTMEVDHDGMDRDDKTGTDASAEEERRKRNAAAFAALVVSTTLYDKRERAMLQHWYDDMLDMCHDAHLMSFLPVT